MSAGGLRVTHIDKNYNLTRWRLSDVLATALQPPSADPDEAKFNSRLVDKLKYCKDVLLSIRNASSDPQAAPPAAKTTKTALR